MRRSLKRILSLLLCAATAFSLLPGGMLRAYAAEPTYSVTYNGNGAPVGSVPTDSGTYAQGDMVTVPGNTGGLIKTGFTFDGWMAGDKIYRHGDTFPMGTSNVVLYAAWIPVYTVTYDSNGDGFLNGGTPPADSKQYPEGAFVTVLGDGGALYSTYGFKCWNTLPNGGGTNYFPGSTFTIGAGNATLYAIYKTGPDIISETYGIIYNANGADTGAVPASVTDINPGSFKVSGNTGSLNKTGFQFAGWNTAANGSGATYHEGDTISVSSKQTLYALWKPICMLSYLPGGSLAEPGTGDSFPAGANVQLRECMFTPSNPNARFTGWNTQTDGLGTTYMPGDVVTLQTDLTLYPVWNTSSQYRLIYNGNGNDGGALPAITYHSSGSTVTVAGKGTLARSRYIFLGWSDSNGLLYPPGDTFTMPSEDLMLYARWQPACTLSYEVFDTDMNVSATTTHAVGDSVSLPGTYGLFVHSTGSLYYEAYFTGWSIHSDGSGTKYAPGDAFEITGDTTLYAVYSSSAPIIGPGPCTITYSSYGSQVGQAPVDPNTYNVGEAVTILGRGSLIKTGYTFAGWQRGDGSGTVYAPGSSFTFPKGLTSLVLFPKFNEEPPISVEKHNLEYSNWGAEAGMVPAGSNHSEEYGTVVGNTGGLVRTGYHFAGWNTQQDGLGTSYQAGEQIWFNRDDPSFGYPGTFITLYPIWAAGTLSHHVRYSENGIITMNPSYAEADTVPVAYAGPAPSGKYFTGWNTQADGSGAMFAPGDHFPMLTGDVTLYAIYGAAPAYFVYYAGQGVTGICNNTGRSYEYGNLVTTVYPGSLAGPAGTYFAGWNTKADGSDTLYRPGDTFTMGNSSITLYGIWMPYNDRYTVTYEGNGADTGTPPVQSGTFYAGQTVTLALVNTKGGGLSLQKSGYILTGWYVNGVFYKMGDTYTIPNANVIAKAAWAPLTYPATSAVTVAYSGNGSTSGTTPASAGYALNSSFALPDNIGSLERPGYAFSGWNDGINTYRPGNIYTLGSMVGSIEFCAEWQPVHTVTYHAVGTSGGTVPSDTTHYTNGQTVTLAGNTGVLTRTNAVFAGWCVNGTIYHTGESFLMGTTDVTATAIWVAQLSDDATLSDLKIGGSTVPGFASDKYEYNAALPAGTLPGSAAATVGATPGDAGASVQITQAVSLPGDATVSVTSQSGTASNTYTVHLMLQTAANTLPNRRSGVPAAATASITTGGTYLLNLEDIFEDADSDPLTYEVSVNSAGYKTASAAYTYKPSAAGKTTLVFRANDGTGFSTDTYTVKLTATDTPTYAVTVNGGTGAGNYAKGAIVTLTADPAPGGQRFKEWNITPMVTFLSGTGTTSAAVQFTMPGEAVLAAAVFEALPQSEYAINIQNDGNGIANASAASAAEGTEITLTVMPNAGYRFKEWQVISGGVTIAGNKFTMPANNVTVKAVFESTAVLVKSITVTGAGGANSVTAGSTLQMHAAVEPADATDKNITWSVAGGSGASIDISGLLTAVSAGKVTVRATAQDGSGVYGEKEITVMAPPPGGRAPVITTVTLPKGKVGVAYKKTLKADGDTPVTWSKTDGDLPDGLKLSGGGVLSGTPAESGTYYFTVRAKNGAGSDSQALGIVIRPEAQPVLYTITATAGNGGSISPSGTVSVTEYDSQTFTITPNTGYSIASVTVDGADQGAISSYTFSGVTAGHTIRAEFQAAVDEDSDYFYRTLTDSATGISVSGILHKDAVLTVTDTVLDSDAACDAIRKRGEDVGYIQFLGKDISLLEGFRGLLTITFPVDPEYNGQTVDILHCVGGTLETFSVNVADGKAVITVSSLSPFAVFAENEETLPADVPEADTGGSSLIWWLLGGVMAVGIGASILLIKRKGIYRR